MRTELLWLAGGALAGVIFSMLFLHGWFLARHILELKAFRKTILEAAEVDKANIEAVLLEYGRKVLAIGAQQPEITALYLAQIGEVVDAQKPTLH